MHYHLISVSLCCSAADLLLHRIPFTARLGFRVNANSSLAGHPPQLLMPFACLYAKRLRCLGFCHVRWSSSWSGMCPSLQCLGAQCLGSVWGVEVPGHPVLGSLHSPSTVEKGYPWVVPASRVAMDTSPSPYGCCSPLTFAAPVPKLINL